MNDEIRIEELLAKISVYYEKITRSKRIIKMEREHIRSYCEVIEESQKLLETFNIETGKNIK